MENKRTKESEKKQKGITLIALTVTIIVLLIMAGVSINAVLSDNGIIKKAQEAQNKANAAIQKDMEGINYLNDILNEYTNGTGSIGVGNENGNSNNESENNTTGGIITPTPDEPTLPTTAETTPYFPSATFSKLSGTELNTGLVIQDSTGNQYVWIEVPISLYNNSEYNTETTTADQKPANSTDYDKIEYCLHQYTSYYRNGTDCTDTHYSDKTTGLTETQYNELKHKMLKSVYENGGFWVARYEAGIEKNRTEPGEVTEIPVSKPDVYPYNYLTCSQAQTLANMLTTEDYTSSLMFGVQWDLILKFIETKSVENKIELATIQNELRSDSTNWGNYYNNLWNIDSDSAKYSLDEGVTYQSTPYSKTIEARVFLTTGASEKFMKMNISDLAGNVAEWLLEKPTEKYTYNECCTIKGGDTWDYGSIWCAGSRDGVQGYLWGESPAGFRVSLYK